VSTLRKQIALRNFPLVRARVIDGLSDFVEAFSGQHDRLN
jgi:hypothetical protein